ncbi:precorrin-3B C(17)-methyltransferase [Anaerotignum faecicola]|nr:precorrin-3B C(17)-methyltransferase [Anaerotignum faecicola]
MNKLYVVGIGPGSFEDMTIRALNVLNGCDVIIGYTVYVELVRKYFKDAEFLSTPMRKEKERCIMALEQAAKGRRTAVICSGDAGVYGMAGLVLELGKGYPNVEIEVVSGITAALSGGALLGAPLTHDFAVISLSDLLTSWETIENRLKAAAEGDFAVCIYNPSSKKREGYLKKACDIMLKYKDGSTVCAAVRNIGREGVEKHILTLNELREYKADMFTTVFIGSSETKEINGFVVTPRGYSL